jgi:hypothetical protein
LDDTKDCLYRFRGHLVRHFQQTQAKLHALSTLGPTEVFLTADWSAVRTGQKHKTPQSDGYAQVREHCARSRSTAVSLARAYSRRCCVHVCVRV